VWLDRPDGDRVAVSGNVSFGRTAGNTVALPDERVSRRHALIHPQGEDEFWLVDLGSRNGTYVNQRRVSQPQRLRDADRIQIGPFAFTFRQSLTGGGGRGENATTLQTLMDVRTLPCWLLVLDVEGSTELAKSLPAEELAVVMGRWFNGCKAAIESHGGTINKYLGDGLLAYWQARDCDAAAIARTLDSLRPLQRAGAPAFRFVLHRGPVTFGGVASLGEESLSGPEVNFVFRMEKVAGSLKHSAVASETAAEALTGILALTPLGEHDVPGFEGRRALFGC
jgi:adenylate cyclase